jgi:hypothetical protein
LDTEAVHSDAFADTRQQEYEVIDEMCVLPEYTIELFERKNTVCAIGRAACDNTFFTFSEINELKQAKVVNSAA